MVLNYRIITSLLSTGFLLGMLYGLIACNDPRPAGTGAVKKDTADHHLAHAAQDLAGNFSTQTVLTFDSAWLTSFFSRYPTLRPFETAISSFYRNRHFSYAWYDANGQIEQAGSLYMRLQNLPAEGINIPLPYLGSLDSMMAAPVTQDAALRTETELLLSGLYFYYASKVWGGQAISKTTDLEWFLPRKKLSYESLLDSMLRTKAAFAGADEPVYRQYNLLKPFLKKYQDIEQAHAWEVIRTDAKSHRTGDSSVAVLLLKKRLRLTGDFTGDTSTAVFDSAFQAAVRGYQHRYGMKEDGIIGQAMLRQLNTPLQQSIQTILVNMERSRWLPLQVEGDYFAVNIPEFRLHAYRNDSLLWNMNVVVGRSVSKTVVFSGQLSQVVFSPYWNIPSSIVRSEVLPGIRRDKSYLSRHHMEAYSGGYRQTPGPWNSLGQVKFLFPNSYSIYLHDTPSKGLFTEDRRAFSHGCIRVSKPAELAAYLLRNDTAWTQEKITAAMNSGTEKWVTLRDKIPVFITYFTAWVDRQGKLNFRDDIYDRDARLAGMMMQ